MDNNEKRGIRKEYLVMIIIAVAVAVSAVLIGSYINSKSNERDSFNSSSSSYSSTYKDIYTALEDRSIYYGMTYEEIKKVCGPANHVSRTNGEIQYAYHGAYDNVQLCFQKGRLVRWND